MLRIVDHLERYDEETYAAALADLPESWQARVTRYKPFAARLRSVIGYTLLKRILQNDFRLTTLPALQTDEHGKPYLVDCPLHFSISHCSAAVVVIVEEHPVGIDVQDILTDISPALAARIAAPDDPQTLSPRDLTALWTKKEASAKLNGKGLKIGLENLPLKEHQTETCHFSDYIVSIAQKP